MSIYAYLDIPSWSNHIKNRALNLLAHTLLFFLSSFCADTIIQKGLEFEPEFIFIWSIFL